MILQTERLTLAPLEATDSPELFAIMSHPEVMAHWDVGEINDPELVDAIVAGQMDDMGKGSAHYWSIRDKSAGPLLGVCDLSDIDLRHKRAEVGFMLGREAWGQGYGGEALRAVVAFAGGLGLRKLAARTHLGNLRSDALLLKQGFQQEGLLRGYVERDGERRDCRLFGLEL